MEQLSDSKPVQVGVALALTRQKPGGLDRHTAWLL